MWNLAAEAQAKRVGRNAGQHALCYNDPDTLSEKELEELMDSADFLPSGSV